MIRQTVWDWCLKLFLLGCMVFYVPGHQFYGAQECFFQYGVMAMFAIGYFVPVRRKLSNVFMALVLIYAILNTVLFHFQPLNRIILLNMFLGFVLIKEIAERVDFNFKSIGEFLALFCVFNALWIILQMNRVDPVFSSLSPQNMPEVDVVGWMGLKSNLGSLAALSFPFIWMASPLASLIVLPLLWFGHSSAAIASVAVTLFFILWHKDKRLFLISLVLAGIAGVLYILKVDMPSGEFGKRFPVWLSGIRFLAGSNPWFGNGLGEWAATGFTTVQENGEPQTWLWAHNTFIQYLFELGVVGFLFLAAYLRDVVKRVSFKVKEHVQAMSLLIPLVITSAIHFPWHLGRFAGLCCFTLAYVEALLTKKDME